MGMLQKLDVLTEEVEREGRIWSGRPTARLKFLQKFLEGLFMFHKCSKNLPVLYMCLLKSRDIPGVVFGSFICLIC